MAEQAAADTETELDEAPVALESLPEAATLDPPAPRDEAPEVAALDDQGLGVGWVLQVATVSAESRAEALRIELANKGYKAFVEPLERGGDTLYRVKIGPKVERAKLEPIQLVIDRELGVASKIQRYIQ